MAQIVISEFMHHEAVADLAKDYPVLYDSELVNRRDELEGVVSQSRALIVRNRTQVDERLLERAARLEVVGRLGVGLDNIDLAACERRGVKVCPATGAGTVSVAEYVVATMLVLLRGATYYVSDAVVAGQWPRATVKGSDAAAKCLGLIGFGAVAQAVAKRALALEMSVLAHDPYVRADNQQWPQVDFKSLTDVVAGADVISVHVPLNRDTRNLIDAEVIAGMRRGTRVINSARGGVVNEEALLAALRSGHLGGAALDVFEAEPLDARAGARFAHTPNLLLTPHIAGITHEANERTGFLTAQNVRSVLEAHRS